MRKIGSSKGVMIKRLLFLAVLIALTLAFRYPYWINPTVFNSDHAVVGLQALEILKGYRSWYLWGVGYQSSFEPFLTAIYYRLFGFSHHALAVVGILGFVLVIISQYFVLLRWVVPSRSFLLCCFAIPSVMSITQITVFPPRIYSLTFMFLACVLLNSRTRVLIALGAFVAFFSLYIDYYVIQLLPGVFFWGYFENKKNKDTFRAFGLGSGLGVLFLILCRLLRPEGGVPLAFSPKIFLKNVPLLWNEGLPALFGYHSSLYNFGSLSNQWVWMAKVTAIIFLVLGIFSAIRLMSQRQYSHLAMVGVLGTVVSLLGFSGSSMASDVHSVRYLGVICWLLPFTLLPVVQEMKAKFFWGLFPALLIVWTLIGWNSYFPLVKNLRPVRTAQGNAESETLLIEELRKQKVEVAAADYWTSYRLSLLSFNRPIIVPNEEGRNRFWPYWDSFQSQANKIRISENPEGFKISQF